MHKYPFFKQASLICSGFFLILGISSVAHAEFAEIYCTIRDPGGRISCLWVDKDIKRKMTSGDISNFIDQAQVAAYITLKSRAGHERVFAIDPEAAALKKLNDAKRNASISDINKMKSDLFNDIEAKIVKLSDELDNAAGTADLIKYDPSVAVDKSKIQNRELVSELENYRKSDPNYMKTQKEAAGDPLVVSALTRSRHSLTAMSRTVQNSGTFSQSATSTMSYNSVDMLGTLLNYRYSSSKWFAELEYQGYTAYTNYNKGSTGTVAFTGNDTSKSVNQIFARGNYCFSYSASQICPGLEVVQDQFAVIGFRQLDIDPNTSAPASTSTLEMQTVTDLSAGANVVLMTPVYKNLNFESRLGYLSGAGTSSSSGNNKSKKNSAYYITTKFEWEVWQGLAVDLGLDYFARTSTIETSGNNNNDTKVNVDNNSMAQFIGKAGLTWAWGH